MESATGEGRGLNIFLSFLLVLPTFLLLVWKMNRTPLSEYEFAWGKSARFTKNLFDFYGQQTFHIGIVPCLLSWVTDPYGYGTYSLFTDQEPNPASFGSGSYGSECHILKINTVQILFDFGRTLQFKLFWTGEQVRYGTNVLFLRKENQKVWLSFLINFFTELENNLTAGSASAF